MERLFTSIAALVLFSGSHAQNIGIGITTPRAKLHVFAGASGNTTPFLPVVVESNTSTYINLLSPDAFETSVLFGKASDAASGGIVYNNVNTPNGLEFRTNGNLTRMAISSSGNVGIGTSTPNAPLAFPAAFGKKITLFPGATGDVGFAVAGNLLQIYSDHFGADIAFGYDQAGVFIEKFRMKANGAFAMLGNAGVAGQVLQSNGQASPAWINPTNALYNNTIMLQSSAVTTITGGAYTALPGLSHSFTVNSSAKVLVTFSIYVNAISCFACGDSDILIGIFIDGALAKPFRQDVRNNTDNIISGTLLISVGPGSHTISFSSSRLGPDVSIGSPAYASLATLQIIPQ